MTTDKNEHARANARGWSETITALVAALECDFDRLEELRDERAALAHGTASEDSGDPLVEWDKEYGEELRDLEEAAAGDDPNYPFKEREHVEQRIQESPLSVQVRAGWRDPGDDSPQMPEEFEILLSTGGPALRIMGELDEHCQPTRAWLQYQDWGTPWTDFVGESAGAPSRDTLLAFCQCFYFGG